MDFKTQKDQAGWYTRTDSENVVTIRYFDHLRGWVAQADWDRFLMTDPLTTKREAVLNADYMLRDADY